MQRPGRSTRGTPSASPTPRTGCSNSICMLPLRANPISSAHDGPLAAEVVVDIGRRQRRRTRRSRASPAVRAARPRSRRPRTPAGTGPRRSAPSSAFIAPGALTARTVAEDPVSRKPETRAPRGSACRIALERTSSRNRRAPRPKSARSAQIGPRPARVGPDGSPPRPFGRPARTWSTSASCCCNMRCRFAELACTGRGSRTMSIVASDCTVTIMSTSDAATGALAILSVAADEVLGDERHHLRVFDRRLARATLARIASRMDAIRFTSAVRRNSIIRKVSGRHRGSVAPTPSRAAAAGAMRRP